LPGRRAELFLLYSYEDGDIAAPIAGELARRGMNVWWHHDFLARKDYRARTAEIFDRTQVVIVPWPQRSVQRDWVTRELADAKEHKLPVRSPIDSAVSTRSSLRARL
jgi:hypothetical protein